MEWGWIFWGLLMFVALCCFAVLLASQVADPYQRPRLTPEPRETDEERYQRNIALAVSIWRAQNTERSNGLADELLRGEARRREGGDRGRE